MQDCLAQVDYLILVLQSTQYNKLLTMVMSTLGNTAGLLNYGVMLFLVYVNTAVGILATDAIMVISCGRLY